MTGASSPRPLRVWVISPELHRRGGTERCVTEQLQRWNDRFDLEVWAERWDPEAARGLRVHRVWVPPGPHLLRWVWWYVANTAARRWWALRHGPPDVVFSPGINAPDADAIGVHIVFAAHWDRVSREALRSMLRGPDRGRWAHRVVYWGFLRALERRIYSGPALVWAVSRTDAAALETRFGRPVSTTAVVPHGVDLGQFRPGDSTRTSTVLIVGNDIAKKGIDVAARALDQLSERVTLEVLGRVDRAAVTQAAGIHADRIRFLDPTPTPEDHYRRATVVVAPSREDAFGLPPLEAMACGTPAVVSSRAGVAELVEDGRHALVLRNPEDPAELAAAVRRILENPELAERLSREGRALAERCSWDANAEAAAALIEREATTPRVLVLGTDVAEAGGVGRATRSLLSALVDAHGADRVGVLAVWGGPDTEVPGWVLDPGRPGSGRVEATHRAAYAARVLRAARRWRRRLVIVAAHPHLAPLARMASRVAGGAPYVVWNHGFESWAPRDRRVRAALHGAHALWTVSRHTADRMVAAGFPPERIRIIPHAVPAEVTTTDPAPAAVSGGGPVVLTVCRLDPEHRYKGIDTLLAAWPGVRAAHPDAELVIVGDGPDRPALERMARSVGATGVRFTGRITDGELAAWYRRAAVFTLPARVEDEPVPGGEGFGLVFVEAMAAGLPVVAGDAGPAPEIVEDGTTGLLVDPRDPQAVAGAIAGLLDEPERAAAMGAAGRAVVAERFSPERFRRDVEAAIADLAPRWRR